MWNSAGTNILVALGAMAKTLERGVDDALRESQASIPTSEGIEALVVKLCHAKESLQRCLVLRDEVSMAIFDKTPVDAVIKRFLDELTQEETRRWKARHSGTSRSDGHDYIERVSLTAVAALREAVSDFRNVAPVAV